MYARLNQVSAGLIEIEGYVSEHPKIAFKGPWSLILLSAPTQLGSRSTEQWVTGKLIWMGETIPVANLQEGTYFDVNSDGGYELLRAMESGLANSDLSCYIDDLIIDCLLCPPGC